ncbi:efflux RND transporter permease subunit, partial [Caldithrix abyssi]
MKNTQDSFRNTIFRITTERPVAILMVVIGIFVFGMISYQQLPLNLMPEMTYPSLTVRTEYPGTAPEEVENAISRPIEQALGVVDNLVTISSVSKAEQSDVILEFTWDTDMNKATADVREKLDQVMLPLEVKRPIILRYDPSLDPIMRIGLYGDVSLTFLRYLAEEEIKRALETIDGVAAVKVKGGLEEEIRVELDEQKLTLIGMDIQTVRERLAEENINMAGGKLKEGETEYLVRTLNEFRSVKEIENIVIGRWNGVDLKIKDVGTVTRTSKERQIITRIGGKESVEIEIYKEADANIVAVARRVKNRLYGTPAQRAFVERLKKEKSDARKIDPQRMNLLAKQMTNFITYGLPEGVSIKTLSDQSIFIENSINEVKKTAIQGGLLAILILFIFLRRLGPTVIIGISIPLSIVATFAPMKIFNVSLNIMSLGGLALGIGMLVDNSIVVLE